MRNAVTRPFYLASAMLACCATGAFADVNMTLTGVNAGYVMGGVYTSPYAIKVDGTPMLLICDDFKTDIPYIPYSWSAIPTNLADLQSGTNPAGTPKFAHGQPVTPADLANYATEAVLATELMGLPNLYSEAAGEISYAIWGVFDTPLLTSNPTSGEGHLTATELQAAQNYLAGAQAKVAAATNGQGVVDLSKVPGLVIFTPDPKTASQEFIGIPLGEPSGISMPEPSYPAILAMDLLAVAGLIMLLRRRITGVLN